MKIRQRRTSTRNNGQIPENRLSFSHNLLLYSTKERPNIDYLSDILALILEQSGCDAVQLWLDHGGLNLRCESSLHPGETCRFRIIDSDRKTGLDSLDDIHHYYMQEIVYGGRLNSSAGSPRPFVTNHGSVCINDATVHMKEDARETNHTLHEGSTTAAATYRSLALVPLCFDTTRIGLLQFKTVRSNAFRKSTIDYFETIAAKFELALLHRQSQVKLQERIKELTCLYEIAQIASEPNLSFEEKLTRITALLPSAWQYPLHACARIVVDGKEFTSSNYHNGSRRQSAPVAVKGTDRGIVEVQYPEGKPAGYGNPFLKEEERLIANIASQVALMIEYGEIQERKLELERQLIRAGHLSAIGMLAAGIAHELNEPLNTILGFAQLLQKEENAPDKAQNDLKRITEAALHARKIIRELLVFARQTAPSQTMVNLNRIIEDELKLFESLCRKAGVDLCKELDPELPEIKADKYQMLQVITNLMVNAQQAMPAGGKLSIRTSSGPSGVSLVVEDTGVGMSDDVRNKMFMPFFTTKDIDQGTGLGLAVVHGIVTAHGGAIYTESSLGKGTRITIQLPLDYLDTRATDSQKV